MTPTPSQGPPIPQGGGGLMGMTMTMAGGVGGEPGTWNIYDQDLHNGDENHPPRLNGKLLQLSSLLSKLIKQSSATPDPASKS